ncbi:unnamed protein product [Cyprideis torosa]|uniref:Uncharacterized protein n=1 Tax=Cyprideis torosa TaxID=163714 RepID=A0A7R8WBU0_9CRUS|nr:unnamed protein product [Cyprideis torosa]CAG0887358.1 unnamed protein product [Cyprideis torosa]
MFLLPQKIPIYGLINLRYKANFSTAGENAASMAIILVKLNTVVFVLVRTYDQWFSAARELLGISYTSLGLLDGHHQISQNHSSFAEYFYHGLELEHSSTSSVPPSEVRFLSFEWSQLLKGRRCSLHHQEDLKRHTFLPVKWIPETTGLAGWNQTKFARGQLDSILPKIHALVTRGSPAESNVP